MNKQHRKREGFEGQKLIVLPRKISHDFLEKDPITKQIYITDIGYYPKARHHYAERPTGISQHIIIYCVEGRGWIRVNKKRTEIAPAQFVAIPAHTPHVYGSNENDPWTIYWIHFKGEISAYVIDLITENGKNYVPHLGFNENRIRLFEEIYLNLEKGYSADNLRYVNMIFYHFLSSLLYEEKYNQPETKTDRDGVERTIEMMQEKLDRNISLQEFASFAGLSVSHFSTMFRERTGFSPIEYFNHLKIQQACQLLLFSNIPVKEIAAAVGIEDQYYFSRVFSRLMGVAPTEYRKRNIQDKTIDTEKA